MDKVANAYPARHGRLLLVAWASGAALLPAVAEASTTSHAMTTAGVAHNAIGGFSCHTAVGDPIIAHAFSPGIALPTEGYAFCNLSGSMIDHVSADATSATSIASRVFNDGVAEVAASAVADYDHIGARSSATFTGFDTPGLTYHASEGAAIIDDVLTFTGGTGIGYVKYGFTVDGSLFAEHGSEAQVNLAFTTPGNTPQFAFAARVGGGTSSVGASYTPGFTGFTSDDTSVSGSGVVYTYGIGITFGTAAAFEYGLRSVSYAGIFTGDASSNFIGTARLTSIAVTDSLGNPVDFTATSASGTRYDASGAHVSAAGVVPEPATWLMMIIGFGLLGVELRRASQLNRAEA